MEAKLIKTNGSEVVVQPAKGNSFSLKELQGYVGGFIEFVRIGKKIMVVNEEGKLDGLECNTVATEIFHKEFPGNADFIVGDVLLTDANLID